MSEFEHLPALALAAAAAVGAAAWFMLSSRSSKTALKGKDEEVSFPLVEKIVLTHNTRLFRFELPDKDMCLGLPIGQHIKLVADVDGASVQRSYTPTTLDDTKGHFDLVIKVYPDGKMSSHVDTLQIGDRIRVKGPFGRFKYSRGQFRELGMIAGGTGLTPMLQVATAILTDTQDTTKINLIFANVTEQDIFLKDELDRLARQYPDQFSVYYVLDKPPVGWTGGEGFVTAPMIQEQLPGPAEDICILLCGPPPMIKAMESNLDKLHYAPDMRFKF